MPSIFTRIISGDIPGRIVWSDEICAAMVDIRPIHPGHCLVIPRRGVDQWTDLDAETVSHLTAVAHSLAQVQKRVVDCERVGLMIAGFEVPHTHLHVIPMSTMADIDFANADPNAEPGELDEMADRLRRELAASGYPVP